MKRKSEQEILAAARPSDIFTMNLAVLEQEKDEYISRFKPQEYNTVRNFVVTQKVILLYRQALNILSDSAESLTQCELTVTDPIGNTYSFDVHYVYDIKIGKMYVAERNVIFVIDESKKTYYENYISKVSKFPMINKKVWMNVRYMLPKVAMHFQNNDGKFVIIVDKPCRIYPLREILNYFDGKMRPEHVASILTRLYNFVCYLDLIGINHNGITVDNLFFTPGKMVEKGEKFTVDDMRIVGVYGGWFFSTKTYEKIKGLPAEVHEELPKIVKRNGFSSFEVDELSIKRVARELLGFDSDDESDEIPIPFKEWVKDNDIAKNAYEEFTAWEQIRKQSFGRPRFVEMDVSID